MEGVPIKVVLVDPNTGVVGQDGSVQYAGMGFGVENVRSVEVLLSVGVAITVPVVGIAVVVNGFVIPGHGVDVKHGQDAHRGNTHEEDHPRRESFPLLTEGEFSNGEGLAVHAAPQTWNLFLRHQAFPPAR